MIADLSWRWPKRQDNGLAMVSLPASLHLPAQAASGEGRVLDDGTSHSSQYCSSTVGKLPWWSSTRSQWPRSGLRSINSVSRHLQLLSGLRWGPIQARLLTSSQLFRRTRWCNMRVESKPRFEKLDTCRKPFRFS